MKPERNIVTWRKLVLALALYAGIGLAGPRLARGGDAALLDCNGNSTADTLDIAGRGAGFARPASWTAFDPGAEGGYMGAATDGRYVYFAPYYNGTRHHGEVLRLDTQGEFSDADSWAAFDPGDHGVGDDPDGYLGVVFDGRHVYFAPHHSGNEPHGEALRYDTRGAFDSPASWEAFNPGQNGVGIRPRGYSGMIFDGRFIYYAPTDNGEAFHGEVLRFDTAATGGFASAASWKAFDAGVIGDSSVGYSGGAFDGRYVYFAPMGDIWYRHGEVLRLDTLGDFESRDSWKVFDINAKVEGVEEVGYQDAVFDGRFVYLVPFATGRQPPSGQVVRLDTTKPFANPSSWEAFDPSSMAGAEDLRGFWGAVFDGRFIHFVPTFLHAGEHASVMRYDTQAPFTEASSWAGFAPAAEGIGSDAGGFVGGVFDGRHIYFAPVAGGEVLRLDAGAGGSFDCNANDAPDECDVLDGTSMDCDGDAIPDECNVALGIGLRAAAPPALILNASSVKLHNGVPDSIPIRLAGRVELGNVTSEPRKNGIEEIRIGFDRRPGLPALDSVAIESQSAGDSCARGTQAAFEAFAAAVSAAVECDELVLSVNPPLPNGRTYKISLGNAITSVSGQSIEIRALVADVNGNGKVDLADRSAIVGVWTGAGYSPETDLTLDGRTNATDRSAWMGAFSAGSLERCAP